MRRAPGAILYYGSNILSFFSSHLSKGHNNIHLIVKSSFSSGKTVTNIKCTEKQLEMSEKENRTRDELIQKIPELTFNVKNSGIVSNAIVCWHPEIPFPYEMSKPLPLDVKHSESNLKIQSLQPVREVFRKKHHKTVVRELMHLTYTTKHRWFGKFGMERRRYVKSMNPLNQKRDREYL